MRTFICISTMALLAIGLSFGLEATEREPGASRRAEIPSVTRMTPDQLLAKVNAYAAPRKFTTLQVANPKLTPRTPFIKQGLVDVFKAGRWDTSDNYVSMTANVPGGSGGSVAYFTFDPPTAGTYFIMTRFSGHQKTCRVSGPWGIVSGFTANMGDDGLVIASFSSASGAPIDFTMSFRTELGEGLTAVWYETEFVKFDP